MRIVILSIGYSALMGYLWQTREPDPLSAFWVVFTGVVLFLSGTYLALGDRSDRDLRADTTNETSLNQKESVE